MSEKKYSIQDLLQIMSDLRHPEKGCPWDVKQTHQSLCEYLIEESYEFIEAAELNNSHDMLEELGDVLLQVIFHAQIAQENAQFDFSEIVHVLAHKLVSRHPHVFGEVDLKTSEEVETQWEILKQSEVNKQIRESLMDGIAAGLSPLAKAIKIQNRAAKVGFDWPNPQDLWPKLDEEISEFKIEVAVNDHEKMTQEMGDILFTLVNICRKYEIDPEFALRQTNRKFANRFRDMEKSSPQNLAELNLTELDLLWQQVKKQG